jgi:large subunit ribosomal protein L29
MKAAELRELTLEELSRRAAEMRENLFNLKIRHAAGTLDAASDLGKTKKDLARVLTVLNQKRIAEQKGQKAAPAPAKAAQPAAAAEGK